MKYCPYCGAGLEAEMTFCPKCGQRFVDASNGAAQKGKGRHLNIQDESPDHSEHVESSSVKKSHTSTLLVLIVCVLLFGVTAFVIYSFFGTAGVPRAVMDSRDSVVRVVSEYRDGYGLGSGFVVAKYKDATFILTNAHVVEDSPIRVAILHNGEEIPASIFAVNENKDLCLLKINYKVSSKTLPLSATDAKQGTAIYAAGFPSAADSLSGSIESSIESVTLTNGIVSAIRSATISGYGKPVTLLQINAAINPGNSGGPLLDKQGHVVGVNTYVAYDSQGIFAAIAISEVLGFMEARNVQPITSGFDYSRVVIGLGVLLFVIILLALIIKIIAGRRNNSQLTEAEMLVRAEKKRVSRRRLKKALLIFFLILVLVVFAGAMYYAPYYYSNNGDFETAGKFIISPSLTSKYDPHLVNYILAGQWLEQRNYDYAERAFSQIPMDYQNTRVLYAESAYQLALQKADKQDFDDASRLMLIAKNIGYKDSAVKLNDILFQKGCFLLDQGNTVEAIQIFSELEKDGYSKADSDYIASKKEELYSELVRCYRDGDNDKAYKLSLALGSYKDSEKYYTLSLARRGGMWTKGIENDVIQLIGFEDADRIIVSNMSIANEFLKGYWSDSNNNYLKWDHYSFTSNLPAIDYGNSFTIDDGDIVYYEGMYVESNPNKVHVFGIQIINRSLIRVTAYADYSIYDLNRK